MLTRAPYYWLHFANWVASTNSQQLHCCKALTTGMHFSMALLMFTAILQCWIDYINMLICSLEFKNRKMVNVCHFNKVLNLLIYF